MKLEELLRPELTFCRHPATSKKALLLSISEAFSNYLSISDRKIDECNVNCEQYKNEIFEAFLARERLGSTTLGLGIALPHIRCPYITAPVGALIKLPQAIDFDTQDKEKVDLVFALIVPEETENTHLLILAHLAKLFRQPTFRTQLRNTQDNMSLYNTAIHYGHYELPETATA